jgi:hypothetical protein
MDCGCGVSFRPLQKCRATRSGGDEVHDFLVQNLGQSGNDNISLVYAIEGTFAVAKPQRLILDYIAMSPPAGPTTTQDIRCRV